MLRQTLEIIRDWPLLGVEGEEEEPLAVLEVIDDEVFLFEGDGERVMRDDEMRHHVGGEHVNGDIFVSIGQVERGLHVVQVLIVFHQELLDLVDGPREESQAGVRPGEIVVEALGVVQVIVRQHQLVVAIEVFDRRVPGRHAGREQLDQRIEVQVHVASNLQQRRRRQGLQRAKVHR